MRIFESESGCVEVGFECLLDREEKAQWALRSVRVVFLRSSCFG